MRSSLALALLKHRPGGETGMRETRDERDKAMRWKRKESAIKTFLVFVTMAAILSAGVQNALSLCVFILIFMVCARLHEWIPSEKIARLNRVRPTCTVNYDGGGSDLVLWLNYNPPNLLQKPLKFVGTASGVSQNFVYLLSVIFFIEYGFISVCCLLVVELICGYYINVAVDKWEHISRANILLTKEGIGFDYSVVGLSAATALIPWEKISTITFSRSRRGLFETAALQFRISMRKFPQECSNIESIFPGNFFIEEPDTEPVLVLSVRADGLASAVHRKDLIAFITTNVPAEKILGRQESGDSSNIRANEPSYTNIWLDSLSVSNRARLRTSDLSPEMKLGDGRYRVIEQLGSGGQGVAYAAWDNLAGKIIVLKEFVLPPAANINALTKSAAPVFTEADLLRQMRHPNIISLLDSFIEDQRAYLVVEHIDGVDLRKHVRSNGAMKESDVIELAQQMCEILTYLHGLPIPVIHRDFTPDNLIYTPTGKVTLLDFNVAQQLGSNDTRAVVGKHAYLPPEQFRGKATIQSDLYALGATMFFLLTGEDPEPISTSHPAHTAALVSAELDAIVAKATEPSLSNRYENADTLSANLQRLKQRDPLNSN